MNIDIHYKKNIDTDASNMIKLGECASLMNDPDVGSMILPTVSMVVPTNSINPRPPEPFSVTRPPKEGVVATPSLDFLY